MADFFLRPPTLTASNFEGLKSTDALFTVFKDLNHLNKHTKNQEASYNSKLGFVLPCQDLISIVLFTKGLTLICGN